MAGVTRRGHSQKRHMNMSLYPGGGMSSLSGSPLNHVLVSLRQGVLGNILHAVKGVRQTTHEKGWPLPFPRPGRIGPRAPGPIGPMGSNRAPGGTASLGAFDENLNRTIATNVHANKHF